MTSDLRDEDFGSIRQASEIDADQVDDAPEATGAVSTAPVDQGSGEAGDDGWADQMADGEDYDESIGESQDDDRVLATDELDEIDDDDAPEGAQARDEEYEGDDPADIPEDQGGSAAAYDADGDGVADELPEGTDRIVEEDTDDWE